MSYAIDLWSNVIRDLNPDIIDKAVTRCVMTMIWPPSIAEFLDAYDQESNIPSPDEIIYKVTSQKELDELSRAVLLDVGSWSFRTDSEKILRKKVQESSKKILSKMRMNLIAQENILLEKGNGI